MDIFSEKTILTVSRLTNLLRGVLEENFEQVWVQGEVSNLSLPSSGHCYFTLKDSGSQLRCLMFKSAFKNLKFRPVDGMALIVRGRISVYDQRGEYQLICEYLEPSGVGALQTAFVQLKQKLAAEGLFSDEHKLPLPRFPQRVGVVTSPTGAAIHDILNVLKRRFASLELQIYPVRVQGEGASLEIARAIEEMNRMAEVDVLIVGRGGGSLEDLWPFNEEVVARAVYRSEIPVISAVGHETDWSICDFTADLRAPTPSAAAEMVIASSGELKSQVSALSRQLVILLENRLDSLAASVRALERALQDPRTLLGHLSQRVDDLDGRLGVALRNSVERRNQVFTRMNNALMFHSPSLKADSARQRLMLLSARMESLVVQRIDASRQVSGESAARLDVLSPLKTLARGYSITSRLDNGRVITDTEQLSEGDQLLVTLNRGSVGCRVETLQSART